jgi:SAM-dependent methyltransferase
MRYVAALVVLGAIAIAFGLSLPAPAPVVTAPPSEQPGCRAPQAAPVTPAAPAVESRTDPAKPRGRLFPPQDLGLLEAPDRDQWQKPDLIMDALNIFDGAVVADLGAGGGWFTIQLARRVGPNGIVYAEDIQPQMIEAIGRRIRREGLTNVQTRRGTPDDPRLPAGQLDAVLIVDAYHEIEDPVALLGNVVRSLKPNGRVGVVDFAPGCGGPGPSLEERAQPETVIQAAEAAGLRLEAREAVPPFQYLLVFAKDARPGGSG